VGEREVQEWGKEFLVGCSTNGELRGLRRPKGKKITKKGEKLEREASFIAISERGT